MTLNKKCRVFTWHIHGSYLYYLSKTNIEWFLPKKDEKEEGYGGATPNFDWGENVHEVEVGKIKDLAFDAILFQSEKNYIQDQFEILSPRQRELPKLYLEHDPPRKHPTDTAHPAKNADVLLVHVTHFNNLMWNAGTTPTIVVDHGVDTGIADYTGHKEKGIAVINNISGRGRRLGHDVFENARQKVPLDIVGTGSEEIGGLGEIPHKELPYFLAEYRFFFSPIRYTSLALSTLEAMMVGLPVVGLRTAELATVIENNKSGYTDTNTDLLVKWMKKLLDDKDLAVRLGEGARQKALERFNINRFGHDWEDMIHTWIGTRRQEEMKKGIHHI